MRTTGDIFKEARIQQGFTLPQIEKATKIRSKFLQALEADAYDRLPAAPYIQGFIKNYAEFLGLRSTTMLALFRRQFSQREKLKREVVEEPLTESKWRLTPNKVIIAFVLLLVGVLFTYFYTQYRQLYEPPMLTVESPTDEAISKEETVAVFGFTDPDATLMVNGEPLVINEEGKFYKDIPLTIGNNTVVVEATTRIGETTVVTRRVTRSP